MNTNKTITEDLLLTLFDQLPSILVLLDEDLNIIKTNRFFQQQFYNSNKNVQGLHFSEVFDSYNFINQMGLFYNRSDENPEISFHQNFTFQRKFHNIKFTLKKIISKDKSHQDYFLIHGEDQTSLYQKNQEIDVLKQKTNQISKMAILGEMATGLTLEIGTPITLILNHVNQIKRQLNKDKADHVDINKKLSLIKKNANRIYTITKNIDDFSSDPNLCPMQSAFVRDLINKSLELCQEKLKSSDISLIVEEIDPGLKLDCKINQISQIILNLISNSKDAIKSQDSKRWIKLSAEDHETVVRFKITDSGPGIPLDIRQKLFGSFFTSKSDSNGTGLGLTISKKYIEDHYGKFYLDEGSPHTCFIFDIPKDLNKSILNIA